MRLMVFCEDCRYEYSVIAYNLSGLQDGKGLSKCPRCKERSRIGYLLADPKTA